MRRRTVLKRLGAGVGVAATGIGGRAATNAAAQTTQTIGPLFFDSTTGLLNNADQPLTDDALVSVYAHDSATAEDTDGNGDMVAYGSSRIALVATDGNVATIGCPFASDEADFSYGNEEFLLNLWDTLFGGGTVLWDEGHDQYYHLDRFSTVEAYAETQGYTVETTTDLGADLAGASGIVITTPTTALTDAELTALSEFVANGGGVILHSQSDYQNYDATANTNAILAALGTDIRFNDAQIIDDDHGPGPAYILTTDQFNTEFPYFEPRQGISAGPRYDVSETYEATVESVTDGDTFDATIDGTSETVRVLGIDTPESPENAEFEMPHEWPGLGDESDGSDLDQNYPTLGTWGDHATDFARSELAGETVTLSFDDNEGITDPYGRLLAYVEYDADGSGSTDTLYPQRVLETGHGRTYHSGIGRHDQFLQTERSARDAGTGVWAASDLADSTQFRNRAVETVYVPNPVALTTSETTTLDANHDVVTAAETASIPGATVVAADGDSRVAMTGGLIINDAYEPGSGFEGDSSQYDNFTLLTNLIDALSDREGDVLVAGGHGQFDATGSLTAEATSFYQRHLEGFDIGLEGVNDFESGLLDTAQAVIITPPTEPYTGPDLQALRSFRNSGGAVVLMGSAAASSAALSLLNDVAMQLQADYRVTSDAVSDPETNVADDRNLIVSDRFAESVAVYEAYEPGRPAIGGPAPPTTQNTADATTSGDTGSGFGVMTATLGIAGGIAALLRSRGST